MRACGRDGVVGPAVQGSPGQLLPYAAPLLEEEGDSGVLAPVSEVADPLLQRSKGEAARFRNALLFRKRV